jgi:hypothetical protein
VAEAWAFLQLGERDVRLVHPERDGDLAWAVERRRSVVLVVIAQEL